MLETGNRSVFVGVPFEHDQAGAGDDTHDPPVESFCLLCRIQAWEGRAEIESGVRDALMKLDGSTTSRLSAMTGMSAERLAELGGVDEAEPKGWSLRH
ncbi:MAG: hypothetical protein ACT4PP_00670 [Sporichthyaceae bacterium]